MLNLFSGINILLIIYGVLLDKLHASDVGEFGFICFPHFRLCIYFQLFIGSAGSLGLSSILSFDQADIGN